MIKGCYWPDVSNRCDGAFGSVSESAPSSRSHIRCSIQSYKHETMVIPLCIYWRRFIFLDHHVIRAREKKRGPRCQAGVLASHVPKWKLFCGAAPYLRGARNCTNHLSFKMEELYSFPIPVRGCILADWREFKTYLTFLLSPQW